MGTDWQRNQALDASLGGNQYGYIARVLSFASNGVATTDASQPVRWGGEKWDINAWRLYLGPWRPQPEILITTGNVDTAADFPGEGIPPGYNPDAEVALAKGLQLWAQISWGSGGIRHVAFVDWPIGGALCQVSGSYVQVDVVGVAIDFSGSMGDDDPSKLPNVAATLSEEPGGGDSARSATFTYPFQSLDWTAHAGINFPVPPFARSAFFEWDNTGPIVDAANYASSATIEFLRLDGTTEGSYVYSFTAGDIGDPREGIPIPPLCAVVRVVPTFPGGASPKTFEVGCSFELDL
jgi:hypothetical protein